MNLKEAAAQALEALEVWRDSLTDPSAIPGWRCSVVGEKAVADLRAALAEDAPETNFGNMAQVVDSSEVEHINLAERVPARGTLLETNVTKFFDRIYTAPPKREPLTIEGNEFVGDPPAPFATWGDFFDDAITNKRLTGLRVSSLANKTTHGIGGEE